jgi:nitrous oxidase accessory protein
MAAAVKLRAFLKPAAILVAGLLAMPAAVAAMVDVGASQPLQAAIDAAAPGDTLRLSAGEHRGPVVIRKPIQLEGAEGAILRGDGEASVIIVDAPDVTIRGLTIVGSGIKLEEMDSGVFLTAAARRAVVAHNRLERNLVGVYMHGAADALVEGNIIVGRSDLRMNEAGNGIHLWNAPGSLVIGNDILGGRDGIYVISSRKNAFRGNRMRNLRYAVHYMYTNDSEISGNISIGNHAGFAIMYSDRLKVTGNLSEGDRDRGLFLNYANMSDIGGNIVMAAPEKCVFLYNANKNHFHDNWFEGCEIGIHFTAGSERNRIAGNAFVANRTQVKYVGTRHVDWSDQGRGNYWSDNPAFDLDGDGLADTAYKPNDLVDEILWVSPNAKILLNSPAVQVVRWAQAQFPAIYPGGVVDSAPLMKLPSIVTPVWQGALQ